MSKATHCDGPGCDTWASFSAGWDAALDEARAAVATVSVIKDTSYEMRMRALAVIEALMEKP